MTDLTTLSTEQLIHKIAALQAELRTRRTNEREQRLIQAKAVFLDTAAAVPAAGVSALGLLGSAAKHIQKFGRDFRHG
jgi:hypothetical protein